MSLPKKLWEISKFDKGVGNENAEGFFWWSQGLDIEASPPYLRVAKRFYKEADDITLAFAENFWGVIFNGANWIVNKSDGKFFQNSGSGWTADHDSTEAWGGLGLYSDDDYMYYASNGYAGRVDKTSMTWDDTWQLFNVSNSSKLCPISKFLKFICFGNGRYLATWDIGASSWNNARLTLPSNYIIKWIQPLSDWLVISAHHDVLGSVLFLWDGISQTYNKPIRLPNVKSLAGTVENNNLYVITDDGWINKFTGSGLDPLKRFPDMEETDKIDYIFPDAVKAINGVILIGKGADSNNLSKRFQAGGIWVFNPITKALYYKHLMSNSSINSGGVGYIYSIFASPTKDTIRVAWYDGSNAKIDVLRDPADNNEIKPYPYGAFYVTPIFDNTPALRKRFCQEILNFYKPLPNSDNARYVVRYNITEKYQKGVYGVASGTAYSFVMGTLPSDWEVGDEVTVLSGNGASQIRHIKSIDTATKTITVDENLSDSKSYDSTSVIIVSSFKKTGTIKGSDYPNAANKLLKFNARAKKIQLKIEIWSPVDTNNQWDMGLANLTTVYIPDRNVK